MRARHAVLQGERDNVALGGFVVCEPRDCGEHVDALLDENLVQRDVQVVVLQIGRDRDGALPHLAARESALDGHVGRQTALDLARDHDRSADVEVGYREGIHLNLGVLPRTGNTNLDVGQHRGLRSLDERRHLGPDHLVGVRGVAETLANLRQHLEEVVVAVAADAKGAHARVGHQTLGRRRQHDLLHVAAYFALVLHGSVGDDVDERHGVRRGSLAENCHGALQRRQNVGGTPRGAVALDPALRGVDVIPRRGYHVLAEVLLEVIERADVERVLGTEGLDAREQRLVGARHRLAGHGPAPVHDEEHGPRERRAALGIGRGDGDDERGPGVRGRSGAEVGRRLLHRRGGDARAPHRHPHEVVAVAPLVGLRVDHDLRHAGASLHQAHRVRLALHHHGLRPSAANGGHDVDDVLEHRALRQRTLGQGGGRLEDVRAFFELEGLEVSHLDVNHLVRRDVWDGDGENLGVHRARLRSVPAEPLAREFPRVREGHDARLDAHLLHIGGYRGDDALLVHGQRERARVLALVRAALQQLGRYHPLRLARDKGGGEVTLDVELKAVALGGGVDGLVVVPVHVVRLQYGRGVQTRAGRLQDRAVHGRHLGRHRSWHC